MLCCDLILREAMGVCVAMNAGFADAVVDSTSVNGQRSM